MINIYEAEGELTSPEFCKAFAAGCCGTIQKEYTPGAWAGFGSPQIWDTLTRAIKEGHDFYYGDHAYFGRGRFYRVTKNAFQHSGISTARVNLRRLRPFYEKAAPWRKDGMHIVVCPQSDNHHERFGEPEWRARITKALGQYTDRPLVFRKKKDRKPFKQDLINAWCVVTHTSNAAVESIMQGIPAICTGDCAASILSLSDPVNIEHPWMPDVDRMAWAGTLANNQWTLAEIRNGKCWEKINAV